MILLTSSLFLIDQPNLKAQTIPNIVNISLTFHGYSLLLRDPNSSFCVYDGADGAAPDQANAVQASLISEISGQQSGFSYWSAVIIWAIRLPRDLHVQGTANVRAFISSNFKLTGFFSGGGYGMGLVDIDQNNNVVQEFITQGPESIGGNPFTQAPTQYSINTNIDYVFKAGHLLGFAVGLGATTQGFTATVYFGSPDKNSGATLPIQDTEECDIFDAGTYGTNQDIAITSNSAISNFQYDSAKSNIQFTAQLINYTTGYCNVYIPKTLMQAPFTITANSQTITPTINQNSTYYQLYFTNARNPVPIQITGTAISQTSYPTSTTVMPVTALPTRSAEGTQPTASPNPSSASSTPYSTATSPPVVPEVSLIVAVTGFTIIILIAGILKRKTSSKSRLAIS